MPRRGYASIISLPPFFRTKVSVVFTGIVLPQVNSAEIGDLANTIVVVTFSQYIVSSNYSMGVTIKVDGVPTIISNTSIQSDHLVVFYTLSAGGKSNSVVNYVYSNVVGDYANNQGGALGPINITVVNDIGRITRLNDAPNSMQLWKL